MWLALGDPLKTSFDQTFFLKLPGCRLAFSLSLSRYFFRGLTLSDTTKSLRGKQEKSKEPTLWHKIITYEKLF